MAYRTVNLEQGMPTAAQAVPLLEQALRSAKAYRCPVIKIIHGYGSSGRGGVLRTRLRQELAAKRAAGQIKEFVPGEDFSPFSAAARTALAAEPSLSKDSDYTRCNHGITIVVL